MPESIQCLTCDGHGMINAADDVLTCGTCDGTGINPVYLVDTQKANVPVMAVGDECDCPACRGDAS